MTELHKALSDITAIRRQMANTTQFRGYGPVTLAITGLIAVAAAAAQALWVPEPVSQLRAYIGIWALTACGSAGLTAVQMYTRTRRIHSAVSNEMLRIAVEQFLPALGAGVLLTLVLVRFVAASCWCGLLRRPAGCCLDCGR